MKTRLPFLVSFLLGFVLLLQTSESAWALCAGGTVSCGVSRQQATCVGAEAYNSDCVGRYDGYPCGPYDEYGEQPGTCKLEQLCDYKGEAPCGWVDPMVCKNGGNMCTGLTVSGVAVDCTTGNSCTWLKPNGQSCETDAECEAGICCNNVCGTVCVPRQERTVG